MSVSRYTHASQTAADQQNISSLLRGVAWNANGLITYSFPTSGSLYGTLESYGNSAPFNGFGTLSATQQADARRGFGLIDSYTNLTFQEVTETSSVHATVRMANSATPSTAFAFYPSTSASGGDAFFGSTGRNPVMGNFDSGQAMLHEIGHSMGLKHGQEAVGYGAMNANRLDIEFSLMNYPNYIGQSLSEGGVARSSPQSYMMYDIAALQYMYGADFTAVSQTRTYTWSSTTGAMSINGASQGTPTLGVIFSTVWTAGATSTYDLSNFAQNQVNDMNPGGWMLFSSAQRAELNAFAPAKPNGQIFARANVYNALLFEGDTRSLISNLIAGSGHDTIIGNAADNDIRGGAGNDTISGGNGSDHLNGGPGADALDGGSDMDFGSYSTASAGVVAALLNPAVNMGEAAGDSYVSIEGLVGSDFADWLAGDDLNNAVVGHAGDDVLRGFGGADQLVGDAGSDDLMGGAGADVLNGGAGFDFARYDDAKTSVVASLASGGSQGEAAGDSFISIEALVGSDFSDNLTGDGSGNYIAGHNGDDSLRGVGGDDTLLGGNGNDDLVGGTGADVLNGGAGTDFARYDFAAAGVAASLENGGLIGEAAGDSFISVEVLVGSDFADWFAGDGMDNPLVGHAGDDVLRGFAGVDRLYGDEGNDDLLGGMGADWLFGGAGFDYARYDDSAAGVVVNLDNIPYGLGGEAAGDIYQDIEALVGSDFADWFAGNRFGNFLAGHAGDDILRGFGGDDTLFGDGGNDDLLGGADADLLDGGAGFDFARYDEATAGVVASLANGGSGGEAAGDSYVSIEGLVGSNFADTLSGDGNANVLTGRDGNDTFVFNAALSAGNIDTVADFVVGADRISLDLSVFAALAAPGPLPSQSFFVGTAAHDVDDRIVYDSSSGALFYDADGTAASAAMQFATLSTGLGLTNGGFLIIG